MSVLPIEPPQPEALLLALRAATTDHHRETEALLALDRIEDLARYGRILAAFEYFLRHWEPAVRERLPARLHGLFDARSRLAMVRADLAALSLAPIAAAAADPVAGLPLAPDGAVLGTMYVLEGSALGGQVIARGLAQRFGLGPASGAAYFHGFGAATGAHWRSFRQLLQAESRPDPAFQAHACAAAQATFQALARVFHGAGAVPALAAPAETAS